MAKAGKKKVKDIKSEGQKKSGVLFKIWILLGILCLGYFTGLVAYAGLANAFYFIWLIGGIFFLIFAWMAKTHFVRRFVPGWLKVAMVILICIGLGIFITVEGFILSGFYRTPSKEVDYVIVLGAHVRDGRPSRGLAKRLDAAYDYAMGHENVTVVVSGGKGSDETTTEAYAMAAYLKEKGLVEERILLEDRSTNTKENLAFSRELIGEGKKIAVVSNDFHIFRAVHLAAHQGFEEPQALSARDDIATMPANLVREFFGVVKDFACGNMNLFPLW